MKNTITKAEFEIIEELVERIGYAYNKAEAKNDIRRLKSLGRSFGPPINHIFNELVGYADWASGRVDQKEHKLAAANQKLYTLKMYVEK